MLDKNEIQAIVIQTVRECSAAPPPKMEFSKKLIIWAFIYFALFGIVSVVLWVVLGDWPREIAAFFLGPVLCLISYMGKSAYENKAKIQNSKQAGVDKHAAQY